MIDHPTTYALVGLIVGFLVGMTGVGGGSLMTPILILFLRVHPQAAVGTDLVFAAVTKLTGTVVHGQRKTVDWGIVMLLAIGSLPTTLMTLGVLHALGGVSHDVSSIMTHAIGVAMLLTAPSVFFRQELQNWARNRRSEFSERSVAGLTIGLGAALGALVTVSSVGAGAIGLAAMIILYPNRSSGQLVGVDIAHAVPLTLLAGLGHWLLGAVNVPLLKALLMGSVPGVIMGSFAIGQVSAKVQQVVLGSILFAIGVRLLVG